MDSTCIANSQGQGAILAGSPSTMNIACEGVQAKEQFVVNFRDSSQTSVTQAFGNFSLTFIKSQHSPTEGLAADLLGIGQPINEVISPPLGIGAYFALTVAAAKAKYIVPVHWDDFTRRSSETLFPARAIFGDFNLETDLLANWIHKSEQQGTISEPRLLLMNMGDEVSISHAQ